MECYIYFNKHKELDVKATFYCGAEIEKNNSTTITCVYKQNFEFILNVYINHLLIGRIQPESEDRAASETDIKISVGYTVVARVLKACPLRVL